MAQSNLSQDQPFSKTARFVENGAGTYNFDVFVPANHVITDIQVHAEALWTAATSAALVVGDYAASIVNGSPVIGAAIDLDGFIASTNLKATDLTAGQAIGLNSISQQGGLGGAYAIVGTNTHITQRVSTVDRFVRFSVTSVGAGTAGRTIVSLTQQPAAFVTVTQ